MNIDISLGTLNKDDLAILEFKREIILYFKYDNGSISADKFLIRNILYAKQAATGPIARKIVNSIVARTEMGLH